MKKILILILTTAVIQTAPGQTTLRRYHKLRPGFTDNDLVKITVASSSSESEKTSSYKSGFDLTDRGQGAMLDGKTPQEIKDLLNQKYLEDAKKNTGIINLCNRTVNITFSIERFASYDRDWFTAYDRIEALRYAFKISDNISNEVKFVKWNKYATEYGTLDIGTLEYNQSLAATLSGTGKAGMSYSTKSSSTNGDNTEEHTASAGPEASATANLSYSKSRKENQLIKERYIQLSGYFNERTFQISQQGVRETRLEGNVSINLTIKLPALERLITSFKDLYNSSGAPQNPSNVSIGFQRYYIPDINQIPAGGIYGSLTYDYAVRHIEKRANTFEESDDKICFITGAQKNNNEKLIDRDDLKVPVYIIRTKINGNTVNLSYLENGNHEDIRFIDFEEATAFKNWLIKTTQALGPGGLVIKNTKITFQGTEVNDHSVISNSQSIMVSLL